MPKPSVISRTWPLPAILGCLVLVVALGPEGDRVSGLAPADIAVIERSLRATVPGELRVYLLEPPPDVARLVEEEWICSPTIDGVIGATEALREATRDFEIPLPLGSIGLAGNGCGDFWFLHPDHGDAVWIALHESSSIEEDARSVGEHLERARAVNAWADLSEEVESPAPPALVAGLGLESRPRFEGTWTFFAPTGSSGENDGSDGPGHPVVFTADEVEGLERLLGSAANSSNHDGSIVIEGEPVAMEEVRRQFFSESGPGESPMEERARERRERILSAAGVLLERVLAFDDQHLPANLPAARTRTLQYLRSRLDPEFVVEPPFTAEEVADLP